MKTKPVSDQDKTKEELIQELEEMRGQVARLNAIASSGTVHNLAYFQERLAEEVSRSSRYKYNFSISVLEADNFDAYIKKCGGAAGNELLGMLQTILRNALRTSDLFCHFENSRFGYLLPYTDSDGTAIVAERIRQTTERTMALKSMSTNISLTISAGIACFPKDAVSAKMLSDHAFDSLKRARSKGGNCLCYAGEHEGAALSSGRSLDEYTGNEVLLEFLEEEIQRSSRFGTELSLILLSFAEQEADKGPVPVQDKKRITQFIDRYVSCCIRGTDRQFPYDSSKLAILLPNTNAGGAQVLAGKMLQAVGGTGEGAAADGAGSLSLNIGIVSFPLDEISRSGMIKSAEMALEKSRKKGRNQAVLASSMARHPGGNMRDISAWIDDLRETGQSGIYNLVAVVDATEHYIVPHSQNTAKLAVTLGQVLGMHTAGTRKLRVISLLHDIGKIYLRAGILTKPGPLDNEELTLIRKHPEFGTAIVQQFPDYAFTAKAILAHHEHFDGRGYPSGLAGEKIPLESSIIAVAEAFDNMVTPRPYREHLSFREALKEIGRNSGTQFAPVVVNALKTVISNASRG